MIEPTVSRMVWYRPGPRDCRDGVHPIPQIDDTAPLHAMICGVLGPGRVNLAVFGADGTGPYPRVDVVLAQDNDPVQPGQCTWMPFQKGQAAAQATPAIDVSAVHAALEAKSKEIHDMLTGATAEAGDALKAIVAEGEDKLRALVKEITDALQPQPAETNPAPAPAPVEQPQAQDAEPAPQG